MKKTLFTLTSILFCAIIFAQSVPQGINYQAVARDANGNELNNQSLTVRLSVISASATGTVSWQETHAVTTNDYGLFTAVVGQGTSTAAGSSATFDLVGWGTASHYLKVEIDIGGGYLDMGTNELLSVPYALQAGNPGPIGPQGPVGATGATGPQGIPGLAGPLVLGSTGQTLRHNGTDWVATSNLYNDGSNVGVGTDNPNGYKLEVEDSDIGAINSAYGVGAVTDVDAHFDLNSNSNASWGSSINLFEFDENTQTFVDGWNIARQTTNGTGNSSLNFNYGTVHNNNSSSSKVTFTKDGKLGVGTTNPGAKLEVYGNGSNVSLKIHENAGTNEATLHLRRGGIDWEIINGNGNDLAIEHEHLEKFRIDGNTGNVGIGNSSPQYKLDVSGNINFTGNLYQNGSLFTGPQGAIGQQGIQGIQGPIGPAGPSGALLGFASISKASLPNTVVERNDNGWIFQQKIYLTQDRSKSYQGNSNCMGSTGIPGNSHMYSTIYRNCDTGREELLLNGGTASYGINHNGASIHVHGNGDDEHPGALALLTGGLGRLLINRYGEVAVGGTSTPYTSSNSPTNNLYNYMDDGHDPPATHNPGRQGAMDGMFNIWRPQGKPALYIEGASNTEGDIAWKDGEQFNIGTWNYSNTSFTQHLKIESNGDLELFSSNAYKPGGGSWSTASDARLKTDVTSFTDGLDQVLQINPVRFRYNEKSGFGNLEKQYIGVLAQDVLNVAPYMVKEENLWKKVEEDRNGVEKIINEGEKFYTFDPSAFDYMLINAIKEQQEMINKLKEENKNIKNRLAVLETK